MKEKSRECRQKRALLVKKGSLFPLQTEKSRQSRREGADKKDFYSVGQRRRKSLLQWRQQLVCSRNI